MIPRRLHQGGRRAARHRRRVGRRDGDGCRAGLPGRPRGLRRRPGPGTTLRSRHDRDDQRRRGDRRDVRSRGRPRDHDRFRRRRAGRPRGLTVEIKTVSGDVSCDHPDRREGDGRRRPLVIGDGAARLAIRSMSGDVEIRAGTRGTARCEYGADDVGATRFGFPPVPPLPPLPPLPPMPGRPAAAAAAARSSTCSCPGSSPSSPGRCPGSPRPTPSASARRSAPASGAPSSTSSTRMARE